MHIEVFFLRVKPICKNGQIKVFFFKIEFFFDQWLYPLNNPGGAHLTVFDFTHLSQPPTIDVNVLQKKTRIMKDIFSFTP